MPVSKRIKTCFGFDRMPDGDVLLRAFAVAAAMSSNPAYPDPPIDLAVFRAALENFAAAIAGALDGGKRATVEKNRQREELIRILEQLGHYAETHCGDDMAILTSSGFRALAAAPLPPQPLAPPGILKVDQGNTGQLLVSITPLGRKALAYELRYAALDARQAPGPWTTITLPSARAAAPVDHLTPGTIYTFEVRALGKLGHTEWSASATRMCI